MGLVEGAEEEGRVDDVGFALSCVEAIRFFGDFWGEMFTDREDIGDRLSIVSYRAKLRVMYAVVSKVDATRC